MSYMNHHQDDHFDHEVDYKFDDSDLQSTDTLWEDLNLGPTLSVSSTGSLSKERGQDPAYDSDLDLLKQQQQQNFEAQQPRDAPPPERKGNIRMIPEEERVYLQGLKLFLVMASLTAVSFLIVLDSSIIVTAIPTIEGHFNSLQDAGWYGSAYQISSACLQPLTGKIYTNFNTKWTYLLFFLTFEIGSLICGVAQSSLMLILGRAVAGMGSSGIMNGGLTIVSSLVPLNRSPALIGMLMGFCQLGLVAGPLLGGVFTEEVSWRWCFYINLPVGVFVFICLILIQIPDQMIKPPLSDAYSTALRELDLIGFLLFTPAALQLLLALEYGASTYPWTSATVIGLFCGSFGTFVVFLAWEWRQGDKAMIPLSMVAKRKVWTSCVAMIGIYGMVLSTSYYMPQYFQGVKDKSPIESGVAILPTMGTQIIFAMLSGTLIGKTGYYMPWTIFSGITGAVGAGLFATFTPSTPTANWVGYEMLFGASRGGGYQTPIIAIQNSVAQHEVSVAMAILMFCQTLSGSIFLTLSNVIFDAGLESTLKKYAPNVNANLIMDVGATEIRNIVTPANLPGVLKAYATSCDYVFYLTASLGVVVFFAAFGMGWTDIRKKAPATQADEKV